MVFCKGKTDPSTVLFADDQSPTLTEPEKGAGLEIATLLTEIRAIVEPEALLRKAG
jgi:hypothetical protein